jgi:hypothetical protein
LREFEPPAEFDPSARGVGHKEQASTWVWRTHGARGDHTPLCIEPESAKVVEDDSERGRVAPEKRCDVLDEDVGRSNSGNNIPHPRPSPAFVVDTKSEAGWGEGLAGEPAGDDVDGRSNSASPPVDSGSDIVMPRHSRPVIGQHAPAERIKLYLTDSGHARALKAQLEPPHA